MDYKEIQYLELASNYFDSDGVLVDIGGFQGEWTETCLRKFLDKKIYVYEPNFEIFQRIENKFSKEKNVILKNLGVSSSSSYQTYYKILSTDDVIQMSGFVKREIYSQYEVEEIKIKTVILDEEIKDPIDFIKIDTEGFELEILKGMETILKSKNSKFIQFEYGGTYLDKGINLNEVIAYLSYFGYKVYNISDGKIFEIKDYEDDFKYDNFLSTFFDL